MVSFSLLNFSSFPLGSRILVYVQLPEIRSSLWVGENLLILALEWKMDLFFPIRFLLLPFNFLPSFLLETFWSILGLFFLFLFHIAHRGLSILILGLLKEKRLCHAIGIPFSLSFLAKWAKGQELARLGSVSYTIWREN